MPTETIVTTAWMLGIAVVAAVGLTFVPAIAIKRWQQQKLRALCRGKMVLTYDDGPDPLLTPALVELLHRHNAKASFFLLGFRAERSPAVCDLLQHAGHELGTHTKWHRNSWRISPWRAVQDVNDGYQSVSRWVSSNAPFRPPFGKLTTWTWLAASARLAPLRWWTCDGCDTHSVLPEPKHVAQMIAASGGAVVLMHCHDRGADRQRYVLSLTEHLLIAAADHGLEICTMEQLYNTAGSRIPQRKSHSERRRAPSQHVPRALIGEANAECC